MYKRKLANQIVKIFFLIFIIFSPIYRVHYISNIKVVGLNIVSISIIILIGMTVFSMITRNRIYKYRDIYILATLGILITSFIIGVMKGSGVKENLLGVIPYIFLITLYFYTKNFKMDYMKINFYICISVIIAAIMSSFIAFRIIDTGNMYIDTMTTGLVRTGGYVDGGIGVIGGISAIYVFITGNRKQRIIGGVGIVSSLVVLMLGQSRSRIVIGIIVLGIVIISNTIKISRLAIKIKGIKILAVLFVVGVLGLNMFNQQIKNIFDTISNRFQVTEVVKGESEGHRKNEIEVQKSMFLDNILTGAGWGVNTTYTELTINDHNMYYSLLAKSGLLGTCCISIYLINIYIWLCKVKFYDKDWNRIQISKLIMLFIMILGIFNGGIPQYSSLIGFILVYYPLENKK